LSNKAAIKLAITEESQTLRHVVNLYYHFVQQQVKAGQVKIEWIRTDDQLGDMFTKALATPKLIKFRDSVMCDVLLFKENGNRPGEMTGHQVGPTGNKRYNGENSQDRHI